MKYRLAWDPKGWSQYLYWQQNDRRTVKKINQLVEAVLRDPFSGIRKPEPLEHELQGSWSRRITHEHRLVYEVKDDLVVIQQCRYHY